ncbi:conserved hypothetical protein [Culex quinquefasciatus]|uniref:Peptidase S1 domain-containing protein n=1 Tax=Culex quinquefasciatus TaxID=7176 RepID=B0XE90_CULQU|nr:conserved hypothetical protein [Culex quinquefasciatus]|eukprot:XP_001867962.1 conserved hypothetical protein [Culex quinquefasciatus]
MADTDPDGPNRNPKIMHGVPTLEGQYPWQVSLELMHPSYGFIGHWCGGVLIDRNWVLSAAHCVHNELFNLPLPALWTVVLGEYDRGRESGYEQRIPVDKIILHEKYHNFKHDLVLLKLNRPANIAPNSRVKKICLPQLFYFDYLGRPPDKGGGRPVEEDGPTKEDVVDEESELNAEDASTDFPDALPDREDNYLRRLRLLGESGAPEYRRPRTARVVVNQLVRKRLQQSPSSELVGNATRARSESASRRSFRRGRRLDAEPISAIPDTSQYVDCLATGWGKSTIDDELTDILLQTKAPIQNSKKCEEAYGDFIKLHRGHLCAGNLDGTGGTCVGDSGGPLQCRITKHGPWILVGITSFGSGCAFKNYPDVYTKISFYRQWIVDTIQGN